ncbi:Hypothetical protein R9X50_00114200 [Acrodontium crateriforme]|uniref:DUF1996 domain-containing protein n=1 Tax=Acrodontium crateriforme TaxID=150365 RepID=A0AAQ3LYK4_9PEZI|nr:Hypothetical protein R9X50_00114200 [Acrodontium crateriforme]
MRSSTVLAAAIGASGVSAFWRMPCRSRTGVARMDPLVDPGKVADHVHAIHGGGAFSLTSTPKDLAQSECTSCGVTQDKSAYWTPSLHFMYANGSSVMVEQVGGMLAYYLMYMDNLVPFPADFQMVAGNRNYRNFTGPFPDAPLSSWPTDPTDQYFLEQRALGFNCLNYDKDPEPSLYRHQFPSKSYMDANCKDGLRMELAFPSCGNGQSDSPDHQSHVKYPSLVKEGNCPQGFDVHYPFLFFETIWATQAFAGQDGHFAFSMGDPVGAGYHGDFMMGWDSPEFLGTAMTVCGSSSGSGEVQDCPLFTLQSDSTAAQCTFNVPEELKDDDCTGMRDGLPVDVPMQWGPEPATKYAVAGVNGVATSVNNSPSSAPTGYTASKDLSYTAADPAVTKTAQGGIVVAEVNTSTSSSSVAAPVKAQVTQAPAVSQAADGAHPVTTKYITQANEVIEMVIEEVDVTVTAASPSSRAYKRHAHAHGHRH